MFDDMTVCGGPCRYAKGLLRTLSWYLYVAGWVCQDVCSANTVAPKPLQAEVTDNRGKSAATPEGACRSPRHEEPMSGEWDDECADPVAGEWDHNDVQGRKPKRIKLEGFQCLRSRREYLMAKAAFWRLFQGTMVKDSTPEEVECCLLYTSPSPRDS